MRASLRLDEKPVIFVLVALFVAGVVFTMWHLSRLQSQLNESTALEHAKMHVETIAEFRTLYTEEVVEVARDRGIAVTHDYKHREGAIPLPATLSMLLGKRIGELGSGAQTRLYSAYPFPWRKDENQRLFQDPFVRDAWEYWQKNPGSDDPFYRFEQFEGRLSLRYAAADRMRASCVDCHNSHPDTPKKDWRVNDVRGVLEIITPMDSIMAQTQAGLRETFLLMGAMTVLGVVGLVLVIGRFRRTASILETRVEERTQELVQGNKELKHTLDELEETQNQLIIQEKMASLGNLVSGVAHEITTPLGVLNSNNETINRTVKKTRQLVEDWSAQGDVQQAGKVRDLLQSMSSLAEFNRMAAERMIKIVTSLRTFARLDRAAEDDVDIHEGLESTLTLIHNQLKDRVTVHKDYGDVPLVRCHPSQLNQVYMNLLVNAGQAIEGKGEIHLKTYTSEGSVVVEVTDSGVGIPTGNLDRVFDPGFTTKGVKVGTGLALSIVHRIVDEHNGKIEVESKVGEGATFRLFLPIHSAT